jgi:hypothetical protein
MRQKTSRIVIAPSQLTTAYSLSVTLLPFRPVILDPSPVGNLSLAVLANRALVPHHRFHGRFAVPRVELSNPPPEHSLPMVEGRRSFG